MNDYKREQTAQEIKQCAYCVSYKFCYESEHDYRCPEFERIYEKLEEEDND